MTKPIKRYRPERHYMRGPGPKWLEKHGIGVDRVDAVMDSRRPHERLPANMIRTAIICDRFVSARQRLDCRLRPLPSGNGPESANLACETLASGRLKP